MRINQKNTLEIPPVALDFDQARFNMLEQQIRPWDVYDPSVLMVLESVHREDYVPANWRNLALADVEVDLGHGERMLKPNHEARLLQSIQVQAGDRILEIGTGSGFLTACLASLGAHVDSVDIHADFTAEADARLKANGIDNVNLLSADAAHGWGDTNAYDVIVVSGSVPDDITDFTRGLADGGRLWITVGSGDVMEARLVTRVGDQLHTDGLFETVIAPLVNREAPTTFTF
ncbi:MAG: protein-L-isoaspartate O-methyltransferase [Gammaproteobacteria bacterium]|nr:protein-L-isoaspartate O-methyltransferase [Gammaproteobacteria bacterium]